VAIDQDGSGNVLLVTLDTAGADRQVQIEERKVGRTRFERLELDAAAIASQPGLVAALTKRADPDLVLDVRLIGVRPELLDLDTDEVESALGHRFLKVRVRDRSIAPLTDGILPSAETVLGAFIRDLEGRIAEIEAAGTEGAGATTVAPDGADSSELRDALRLGRLLLAGEEVSL